MDLGGGETTEKNVIFDMTYRCDSSQLVIP